MNSFNVILCITLIFGINTLSQAQIWNKAKERLKNKVENKVLNKVDREADKKIDDVLDGDGSKRDKRKKGKKENSNQEDNIDNNNANSNKEIENKNTSITKPSFKAYSKFDFTSGEKIIAFEDFSKDEIGDLPARWNSSNSAEIVALNNTDGRWMQMGKGKGSFVPDFIEEFPDNFTLEYDMIFDYDVEKYGYQRFLDVVFSDVKNPAYQMNNKRPGENGFAFSVSGGAGTGSGSLLYEKYAADTQLNLSSQKESELLNRNNQGRGKTIHISIWKQKQRMRVYVNESKVFDIPRAFEKGIEVKNLRFYSAISEEDSYYYLGNLRYAIGKPDMRSKLVTEGKLVTYGITFDVNSATIKSSSYGTLKKIAAVLKENPTIKVQIVGHTDSDGSPEANQSLSEKRASSIKKSLINEFAVPTNQLSSAGKGESELLDNGSSLESKARNRRVEFLKQ